jgi:hypothetical protein|tara:strand:- start:430 stop:750 length:321 start_codon:yes stop_codon:yes gene_type:complete
VEIKNFFLYLFFAAFLTGCMQSSAMLAPAISLASSGNINLPQAGASFVTNKVVEQETGMDSVSYVSKKIEQNQIEHKKKKRHNKFMKLVQSNFENTRKIILKNQKN